MLSFLFLFAAVVFLAYSNGANDNFKGVATLYGSSALSYKQALTLASVAQFAGSMVSLIFATALVKAFSGSGLVDPAAAASFVFLLPVALAAGGTVILATCYGLPISTTHALIGALVGAGLVNSADSLQWQVLLEKFLAPLLLSPVLAIAVTMLVYAVLTRTRRALKIDRQSALCVTTTSSTANAVFATNFGRVARSEAQAGVLSSQAMLPKLEVCAVDRCEYQGAIAGVSAQGAVNAGHLLSAFSLCFARALNDTPKLVGLLVVWKALDVRLGMLSIAIAMMVGGIIASAKIAATMSKKISAMNDGQALTANFVSAVLVIAASKYGLPVSTTHVTVSAITGIGISNGSADFGAIKKILASWLLTLPLAAALAVIFALAGHWL